MYNIVKNFTMHFDSFLKRPLYDFYTDFKHSTDSLENLKDLTFNLNLNFLKTFKLHCGKITFSTRQYSFLLLHDGSIYHILQFCIGEL